MERCERETQGERQTRGHWGTRSLGNEEEWDVAQDTAGQRKAEGRRRQGDPKEGGSRGTKCRIQRWL